MVAWPEIDLSAFPQIGEIEAPRAYFKRPIIHKRHLIPAHAEAILAPTWDRKIWPMPPVQFFQIKNAYVLREGLVFDSNGALITQTKPGFSDADIASAHDSLALALAGGTKIQDFPQAILCKQRGVSNYGHWLVEMLPKAFWSRRKLHVTDWPILVHRPHGAMVDIVRDSLEAIGIPPRQILETDDDPVLIEELIIIHGLTQHAVFLSPLVMTCMDSIAAAVTPEPPKKIYAVRRPARVRDFSDEPAIAKTLNQIGFTEVQTGGMTFLDQVRHFNSATAVTGAMGAAFTNIIFCQPETRIDIFMPAGALEYFFWFIAEARKLDYREIRCPETGPRRGALPWDHDLDISPGEVARFLSI